MVRLIKAVGLSFGFLNLAFGAHAPLLGLALPHFFVDIGACVVADAAAAKAPDQTQTQEYSGYSNRCGSLLLGHLGRLVWICQRAAVVTCIQAVARKSLTLEVSVVSVGSPVARANSGTSGDAIVLVFIELKSFDEIATVLPHVGILTTL